MGTIDTIQISEPSRDIKQHLPVARTVSWVLAFFRTLVDQWRLRAARYRNRRQLIELTDEQLKDIGLTRAQAIGEAVKPFWK